MKAKGFTLIELLVTLVIIGIIVGMATLAISPGADKLVEERNRLAALFQLAQEEAILQGRELGIEFWENGYAFYELNNQQQWLPLKEDHLLRARELPAGMRLELMLEGIDIVMGEEAEETEETLTSAVRKDKPQVFILSSGETSPFTLEINLNDEYITQLTVSAIGKIKTGDNEDDQDKTR